MPASVHPLSPRPCLNCPLGPSQRPVSVRSPTHLGLADWATPQPSGAPAGRTPHDPEHPLVRGPPSLINESIVHEPGPGYCARFTTSRRQMNGNDRIVVVGWPFTNIFSESSFESDQVLATAPSRRFCQKTQNYYKIVVPGVKP